MIFLKSRERDYAAMNEYRFAMLSIGPEVGTCSTFRCRAC